MAFASVASTEWQDEVKRFRIKQMYRDCIPTPSTTKRTDYPMKPSMAGFRLDMSEFKNYLTVIKGQGEAQVCKGCHKITHVNDNLTRVLCVASKAFPFVMCCGYVQCHTSFFHSGDPQVHQHILGITRVLHIFEDMDGNEVDIDVATSPYLLVAMFKDKMTEDVLSLPLMQTKWSWTRGMVYGLQAYAKWQEHLVHVVIT
jgi:hypothetical protein